MSLEHLILNKTSYYTGRRVSNNMKEKYMFTSCVLKQLFSKCVLFKKKLWLRKSFIFKFQIKITTPISFSDDSDSRSIKFEFFLSTANIFTRRYLYVVLIETYAFDLSMQSLFLAFLNVLISKLYKQNTKFLLNLKVKPLIKKSD